MNVSIVGLGLIGGSLAKDLSATKFASEVVGVESNPKNSQKAIELKLVSKIQSLDEALENTDLVILAVPVDTILKMLPKVLDLVKDKTTVTDMGSTKELICSAIANHKNRKSYVASHPMAGTENSGPQAAVAGLFKNKTAVICDTNQSHESSLKIIEKMYTTLGMRVVHMNSRDHDVHASYVSHLSHISSFVLANTVLKKEKNAGAIFDLAGGGFESTVRLAKSSPEMWAPIFEQNKKYVIQALNDYIEELKDFKSTIEGQDSDKLKSLMSGANEIRRVLSQIALKK